MGAVDDIVDKLQQGADNFKAKYDPESVVQPGDETREDPNSVRNMLVAAAGLPEGWKMSVADSKKFNDQAAQMMAAGSMGSLKAQGITSGMLQRFPGAASAEGATAAEALQGVQQLPQTRTYGGTAVVAPPVTPNYGSVRVVDAAQKIASRIKPQP